MSTGVPTPQSDEPKNNAKKPKTIVAHVTKRVKKHVKVTSPPGKLNLKDHIIAWGTSICLVLFSFVSQLLYLLGQLLGSVADYMIPYLQQVPRHDRPIWLAAVTFAVMGMVILNKRRIAGPDYQPPQAGTLPVQTPSAPSTPAPQGQPLPPGAPVDTTKSAF